MVVNVLRFVCVVLAAVQIGMTLRIAQRYYQIWKSFGKERRGLLPHHVWLIGLAYTMLLGEAVSQNIARLGDPFSWHLPVNLVAFSVGTYALVDMIRFQQKHYSRVTRIKEGN